MHQYELADPVLKTSVFIFDMIYRNPQIKYLDKHADYNGIKLSLKIYDIYLQNSF